MRFRLGYVTGFATGYYLGAKAGRQRYEQLNQALNKFRRSPTVEAAADKAKAAVEEGVEKAKTVLEGRFGDGRSSPTNGSYSTTSPGSATVVTNVVPPPTEPVTPPPTGPGSPYSASG